MKLCPASAVQWSPFPVPHHPFTEEKRRIRNEREALMTKSDFNIRRNILVVGGNGFIGRHVCKAFAASGANVTVFDLAPAQSETEYECITGSISDASLLASTIMGKHTVIFLANASLPLSLLHISEPTRQHAISYAVFVE
jgi:hypothetical protein